nr:hypothetical protein 6 [Alphaproteobacteria bacterium]
MTQPTRDEKIKQIVDHADSHIDKVAFAEQVAGLGQVFALGAPPVFQEIVDDLHAEIEESAEQGRAMIAQLDAPTH